MSKERLLRAIKKQTNIQKLQKLRDSGITKLIDMFFDLNESDRAELEIAIDARILELQV